MQKCILGKPILTQENAAGGEEKEAYFHAYRIREIGEYERKAGERLPGAHRPNEWLWKRIPDQVASNPLERAHRKRFLNMSEYSTFKSEKFPGRISYNGRRISRSNRRLRKLFFADRESIKHAKSPYFLKIPKIREAIYYSEWVCSIRAYKEWNYTLYKAGYAEALVQKGNQRLLTLGESEASGQFFWDEALATCSRGRISIEIAMSQVSINCRISAELLPGPLLPGLPPPNRDSNKRGSGDPEKPPPKNAQKRKREKQN